MGMGNVGRVIPAGSVDVPHDFWNSLPQGWRDEVSDELEAERNCGAIHGLMWGIAIEFALAAIAYGVDLLCRAVFGVVTSVLGLPR